MVGSVEHAPYSCLFAMAGYCVVLPVRIEGKGSGESPCALIPTWCYVISRTEPVSSISECNVGGRPDGKRMNGDSSFGLSRNQQAEKSLVAVLSSMSTKNSCSRTWPRASWCAAMWSFVCICIPHWLTARSIFLFEKAAVSQQAKNSPHFCFASREFITVFTKASHTCPWYESDESNPHCPIRVCTFLLYGLRALPI